MMETMSTFPRAKRSQPGYDIEQVEDFLEDARRAYATDARAATAIDSSAIRRTSFTMQKGGYSPAHVDAALERLEEAFARREHERGIVEHGDWVILTKGDSYTKRDGTNTMKMYRVGDLLV